MRKLPFLKIDVDIDSVLGELSTELCGDWTLQSRTWRAGAAEEFTLGTSAERS